MLKKKKKCKCFRLKKKTKRAPETEDRQDVQV